MQLHEPHETYSGEVDTPLIIESKGNEYATQRMTFEVYGCCGVLEVELITGNVLGYQPDPGEPERGYDDVRRINIPWYEAVRGVEIKAGDAVCIMDLDFWTEDGEYVEWCLPSYQLNMRHRHLAGALTAIVGRMNQSVSMGFSPNERENLCVSRSTIGLNRDA